MNGDINPQWLSALPWREIKRIEGQACTPRIV
jgi:hypothetical protein